MPLFSPHTSRTGVDVTLAGTSSAELLRRYPPIETLATGGFGSIEICRDTHLRRRVAIKRIPLMQQGNIPASAIQDVVGEAYTAAMLQHPNIVQVIDFTYDASYAYLVMEYVDGLSLAQFLQKVEGHSLTFDETAAVADSLGQAISFAHQNGVLHLDIKPANVLIDRAGHVKLTDFGMARLSSAGGFGGSRGGTIGYMPPEQLDIETGTVDERADVFALACVLYEALLGEAPFRGTTPSESLDRIIHGATWPHELIPRIPELAETALMSALSPMPQDRPRSVEAFCDRFLAGLGNPREGRRSLERMVAELTDDEREDEGEIEPSSYAQEAIEVDPALGWAGTRWPDARIKAMRGVAGASCAVASFIIMRAMGVPSVPGVAVAALSIGAAAAMAPQIGSAICAVGLIIMCANATAAAEGILSMLPVASVLAALIAGWWITWGRTEPAASAAFSLAFALAGLTGDAFAAAGPAAAVAAVALSPASAAAATGMGTLFGHAFASAVQSGGVLGAGDVPATLGDPFALAAIALAAVAAAACARLLEAHARRAEEGSGAAIGALAALGTLTAAIFCLAHHMEIASSQLASAAGAAAAGILSSIIVGICLFLLGYQRTQTERDLS